MPQSTSRWPLAAACLGLGALIGGYTTNAILHGQAPIAAPVLRELTSYRDIVKAVVPAVVSIDSKAARKARPRVRNILPEGLPEEMRKQLEALEAQPGNGPVDVGFGSGVIVDPAGVILTNFHVVDGADTVTVTLHDGRKFTTKDVLGDRKTDLALVRVKSDKPLPALLLGDSDSMEVGDRVLAVGAPFGLTGTVTNGIISAKSRNLKLNLYEDFLQTDAAINPGNSGGPLISLEGKVIGINSAIKSRSGGFQGVGLAISSNLAKNVMAQLLKNGMVKRGYLGIQIRELTAEAGAEFGAPAGGVEVTLVFPKSPAAKGEMKAGDIITHIAGKPVRSSIELQKTVASLPLGQPAEIKVMRDGQAVTLSVTIEEQPENFGIRVPQREDD